MLLMKEIVRNCDMSMTGVLSFYDKTPRCFMTEGLVIMVERPVVA